MDLLGTQKMETRGDAIKNIIKLKAFLRLVGYLDFKLEVEKT